MPKIRKFFIILFSVLSVIPTLFCFYIVFHWVDEKNFDLKLTGLLGQKEEVETTASELFDVKEPEFVCLFRGWDSNGRSYFYGEGSPGHQALKDAGLTVDDIPNYKTSFFHDAMFWDYHNNYVTKFSKNKKTRLIRVLDTWQLATNEDGEVGYGCYRHSKKLIIHAPINNQGRAIIQFWD